jgi:hypothetical protein
MSRLIILLALITSFTACEQEKVSRKAESGSAGPSSPSGGGGSGGGSGSGSGGGSFTTQISGYFMSLLNSMDSRHSHHLHATGAGNASAKCNVSDANNPFTTAAPEDIDCFLEVEELDLHELGAKFKLEITKNLCEYVAYVPFSFYQFQPGATVDTYTTYTGEPACLPGPDDPEPDCAYDYTDLLIPGPNCDEGTITQVTQTWANTADPGDPVVCAMTGSTSSQKKCGGKANNCIHGPRKDISSAGDFTGKIYETGKEDFIEEFEVKSPKSKGLGTNMFAANFTRMCVEKNAAPIDNTDPAEYANFKDFEGDTIQDYRLAAGLGGLINPHASGFDYAADPFRGTGFTSAIYGFYCLDQAMDVKARIRLFIRDWDRNFSKTSNNVELVSDIDGAGGGLMDAENGVSGQIGLPWSTAWNDIADWDDFFVDRGYLDNSCVNIDPFNSNNFPRNGL